MYGRSRLSRRRQIVEEHFDSVSGEEDSDLRYNIAPELSASLPLRVGYCTVRVTTPELVTW
jgi:hypothetical protein